MKTFNFLSNAKSLNLQNDKSFKIKNSNQNTSGNNNNEDNSKLSNPKLNTPINQTHTYKKVTEKDCTDLRILVKKSVDDLNDLLNLHEINNISNNFNHRRDNNNGSDILKKKHQSAFSLDNNMNKSMKNENKNLSDSKTNFTFNINNFINIPSNNNQKKIIRYEEDTERTQSDKQNNSNIKNKTQKLTTDKIIKSMNSITVNKKIVKNNTMQFNKITNKEKITEKVLNKKISISPNTKVKSEEMIKNKKSNYQKKFSQTQKLKNTNINILSQKFNSSVSDISSFNYQSSTPRGSDSKNVTKNNYARSISSNSNNLIRNVHSTTNIKKHNSSSLSKEKDKLNYHQILDKIYSKKFPYELGNTNDILKLMLFLNEYLINNNLLKDYYQPHNKNLLNEYSKFLVSKIEINYPEAIEINHSELDRVVNSAKIIQRHWRKKKVKKYLGDNKENHELKKMIINNYIKKSGYKVKKVVGLFNSLIEDFENLCNFDNDLNEMFHYTTKIINNNLTKYEKNLLYKEFINNIILIKYK